MSFYTSYTGSSNNSVNTGSNKSRDRVEVDDLGNGTMYIGKAQLSTGSNPSTSSSVWQIKKLVQTGADTSVTFADGNANYDNVWDDRLSLSFA